MTDEVENNGVGTTNPVVPPATAAAKTTGKATLTEARSALGEAPAMKKPETAPSKTGKLAKPETRVSRTRKDAAKAEIPAVAEPAQPIAPPAVATPDPAPEAPAPVVLAPEAPPAEAPAPAIDAEAPAPVASKAIRTARKASAKDEAVSAPAEALAAPEDDVGTPADVTGVAASDPTPSDPAPSAPAPAPEPDSTSVQPDQTPAAAPETRAATAPRKERFTMTATSTEITDKFQTAFKDASEKAKSAFEKSQASFGDISEFAKGNIEAIVESSKILASGLQELSKGYVTESKTAVETLSAEIKDLTSVKSPSEFFEKHSALLRKHFDSAVAASSKNSEAVLKLANEAFQPISNRVSLAVEKIKQAG